MLLRLQAVQTIHEARIVHSDLKPANFLMVEGQLKLIDFGIAKAISSDTTSIARESQVGLKACTTSTERLYMPVDMICACVNFLCRSNLHSQVCADCGATLGTLSFSVCWAYCCCCHPPVPSSLNFLPQMINRNKRNWRNEVMLRL